MGRRSRQVADAHRRLEAAAKRSQQRLDDAWERRMHAAHKDTHDCTPHCTYCVQDAHDKRIENLQQWEHDLNTDCKCETCTAVAQLWASTQQPGTNPSQNSSTP